jgi:hypothetical protein
MRADAMLEAGDLDGLAVAAAQGDVIAVIRRDIVAEKMTSDQIAEAQLLAREWLEKHGKTE